MNSQTHGFATTPPAIEQHALASEASPSPSGQTATGIHAFLLRHQKHQQYPWTPEDLTDAVRSIDVRVEEVEKGFRAVNEAQLEAMRQRAEPRAWIEFNLGPFRFSFGRMNRARVDERCEPDAGARAEEQSK